MPQLWAEHLWICKHNKTESESGVNVSVLCGYLRTISVILSDNVVLSQYCFLNWKVAYGYFHLPLCSLAINQLSDQKVVITSTYVKTFAHYYLPRHEKCLGNIILKQGIILLYSILHIWLCLWRNPNALESTGWHIRLWQTSRWHQNISSVLAWSGQARPKWNFCF